MKWKCHTCGQEFIARESTKASARANMLKAARNHYKNKHPNTIGRRISRGLRNRDENPNIGDFIEALREGTKSAISVYRDYTERQYQHIKSVLDPMEPYLPENMRVAWLAVQAFHDAYR